MQHLIAIFKLIRDFYCYRIANEALFDKSIFAVKLIVRPIVITIYPIDLTYVEVMMVLNQR